MADPYDIPKTAVPEWMTYRWVRKSVMGEMDTGNMKQAEEEGWRPVPRSRHWNLPAYKMWNTKSKHAEYGGLVLMERPDHMTISAQAELRRKAFEMSGHVIRPREPNETPYTPPKQSIWERLKNKIASAGEQQQEKGKRDKSFRRNFGLPSDDRRGGAG